MLWSSRHRDQKADFKSRQVTIFPSISDIISASVGITMAPLPADRELSDLQSSTRRKEVYCFLVFDKESLTPDFPAFFPTLKTGLLKRDLNESFLAIPFLTKSSNSSVVIASFCGLNFNGASLGPASPIVLMVNLNGVKRPIGCSLLLIAALLSSKILFTLAAMSGERYDKS